MVLSLPKQQLKLLAALIIAATLTERILPATVEIDQQQTTRTEFLVNESELTEVEARAIEYLLFEIEKQVNEACYIICRLNNNNNSQTNHNYGDFILTFEMLHGYIQKRVVAPAQIATNTVASSLSGTIILERIASLSNEINDALNEFVIDLKAITKNLKPKDNKQFSMMEIKKHGMEELDPKITKLKTKCVEFIPKVQDATMLILQHAVQFEHYTTAIKKSLTKTKDELGIADETTAQAKPTSIMQSVASAVVSGLNGPQAMLKRYEIVKNLMKQLKKEPHPIFRDSYKHHVNSTIPEGF